MITVRLRKGEKMRLIDADALIVEFNKRCRGECCCCTEDYCGSGNDGCGCRVIDDAPTVDAVEVVRCKDCKKYIPCQKLPIGTSKWCDLFDRATCEMNYCGWGERRKDEDE